MSRLALHLVLLAAVTLVSLGCGNPKVIDDVEYDTYGLINKDEKRNEAIQYDVIWGNVIWGCLLVETVIAPVYFFGFSLFEPVGPKPQVKGQVTKGDS